ncbi:hypothetical protein [Pseudomonas pseudonitroreducens]|uniref:hypothetical protein n=1 Tax=Pseudomonas pseudonitroreducens TaxID=2892326 RepID=UPI001F217BC0|nr:hypothetical protein [Pseudomonas pseudonitroreducens]
MKTENKFVYGDQVVEFYTADQNELQECIQLAESKYYNAVATLDNPLAANIQLMKAPLVVQLPELFKLIAEGYTVHPNKYCGVIGQSLDITLTKPQKMIDKELAQVHKQAEAVYEQQRWIKNSAETEKQLQITADRIARDAEKARLAAEQKMLEEQREAALADLRAAYAA